MTEGWVEGFGGTLKLKHNLPGAAVQREEWSCLSIKEWRRDNEQLCLHKEQNNVCTFDKTIMTGVEDLSICKIRWRLVA